MEYSPPALSSYRYAHLAECGIDTQAGNKNRLSRVMFCLSYVNFISCPFRSLSHKPLLIQYSVNNKRLKSERNLQLIFFVCVMHLSMFSPRVGGGGRATHGKLTQPAFPWVGILTVERCPWVGNLTTKTCR